MLATIHQFPSLEPLRLESFPANHLYLPTRKDILHRAVIYEGDMTRLGTASTKTRYEVHGSARKIRPQKGTGRARLGDKKSPMLRGGGVAHGPKPRDFSTGLQKKVYDLAWRTALSYRFRKGELIIVDNAIEIESPSQRLLKHIFDLHDRERGRGRSLLVTLENRPLLEQALDGMDRRRQALTWREVDVKDLLELSRIIIERSALHNILLAHQEDLTHKAIPPWHKSFTRSSAPSELESIPGWSEFRHLMTIPPSERDVSRPDIYEGLAYDRWSRAAKLPEGPEKLALTISAYELLADAKDMRRKLLPPVAPAEAAWVAKEQEQEDLTGMVDTCEAHVYYRELHHQHLTLSAQAAEHRADAFRWRGADDAADEEYDRARDTRTDVSEAEMHMYAAKRELATTMSQMLEEQGDAQGARAQMRLAEEMQREEDRARAEMEHAEGGEELTEAELAELEREEKELEKAEQAAQPKKEGAK